MFSAISNLYSVTVYGCRCLPDPKPSSEHYYRVVNITNDLSFIDCKSQTDCIVKAKDNS